ncbi:MAG TPA: hypothetical protein VEZ90_02440 [Blastocatellia bacterium]|nr:hypothetical protein [Blastocatellia bacterium]
MDRTALGILIMLGLISAVPVLAYFPAAQSAAQQSNHRYEGRRDEGQRDEGSACLFTVYKEGEPVIGGYRRRDRGAADFDPNVGPHGPHVTPEILKDRMYFYYFEVQALIANAGKHDDWSFNQRLDRSGWLTVDLGEKLESARVNIDLHQAADNPGEGDFVWDSKGYHYASAHGIPVDWPTRGGKTRPVKNADIIWKFTVTGHHESEGHPEEACTALIFYLHLIVNLGQPVWTLRRGEEPLKLVPHSH